MKRFRDVVFSNTEPDDKNVIWVYPVPLEKGIYKVFIYNSAWEDVFSGQLDSVKQELIRLITENERQINSIKEELDGEEGITAQLSEAKNNINNLQSDVTDIQDILGNEETGLIHTVNQHNTEIYGDGTSANPGLIEKVERIPDAMIIQGIETSVEAITGKPNPSVGDVYLLKHEDDPQNIYYEEYVYTNNQEWVNMGLVNNLDNYYTKSQIDDAKLQAFYKDFSTFNYKILAVPETGIINNNNNRLSNAFVGISAMNTNPNYDIELVIGNVISKGGRSGIHPVRGILTLAMHNNTQWVSLIPPPSANNSYNIYLPEGGNGQSEHNTLAFDDPATLSKKGLMTAEDKIKLENLVSSNVPIGGIIMYSGSLEALDSEHWALCDGTNGTPDLRDKFIVGAGHDYLLGAEGGKKEVTLKDYESGLPKHVHAIAQTSHAAGRGNEAAIGTDGKGFGSVYKYNESGEPSQLYYTSGAETQVNNDGTISIARSYVNTGKDAESAHENRPPFKALYYIMRIA